MRRFEEQVIYKAAELDDTNLSDANLIVRPGKGTQFKFDQICQNIMITKNDGTQVSRCITSPSPLDFVYSVEDGKYLIDDGEAYDTDEKLIEKIQTGRGDPRLYQGAKDFIYVPSVVGDSDPANIN